MQELELQTDAAAVARTRLGKDGEPSPAALGFARKQGVEFSQLARVTTPKGEYLAFHRRQRGRSAVNAPPRASPEPASSGITIASWPSHAARSITSWPSGSSV